MGVNFINVNQRKCLCERAKTTVLCNNCGHVMFGRVRYECPKHTMVSFLCDITQCPKCRALRFMLMEVDPQYGENDPKQEVD